MGEKILCREILEHVLQYADGETLLMCREVSPEFADVVAYLAKTRNIWKKCFFQEERDKYPYEVIAKLHAHMEGLNHKKNWGAIYETRLLSTFLSSKEKPVIKERLIGKMHSEIKDIETHDDIIILLVKYNKDFSKFFKILTVDLNNKIIDKSCRFIANLLYLTPIEDLATLRPDTVMLSCNSCLLVAVPVFADEATTGYPKFRRNDDYLTVEHANGELLWINTFGKFITKGKCFHTGRDAKHEEIKLKDKNTMKIFQRFTCLYIACGETRREFNTFEDIRSNVTASLTYCDLAFLGTDTGMLYVYKLSNEDDLRSLNLAQYIQRFDVCSNSILVITVMELKESFVIICSSEKTLYQLHIKRKLLNLSD